MHCIVIQSIHFYSLKKQLITFLMQHIEVKKMLLMVIGKQLVYIINNSNSSHVGVSECIIMGIPMTIGTGMFKVLYRYGIYLMLSCILMFS